MAMVIDNISDRQSLMQRSLVPLSSEFFERPTAEVAKDLLGKLLVRVISEEKDEKAVENGEEGFESDPSRSVTGSRLTNARKPLILAGIVVETEAYLGVGDPASHACNGPTPRSSIMFGPPGVAYVYLNYGVHYLLNVVTEKDGTAGAVLLRGLEPVIGIDLMRENRAVKNDIDLSNGPGKLTKALGVTINHNGIDMTSDENGLFFAEAESSLKPAGQGIEASPRIGISNGKDKLLRFTIAGNPYLSR
jgi:DNA-3-methyladenine glycosylase